jgi:hypothetical protein
MGIDLKAEVLSRAGHSERSEPQIVQSRSARFWYRFTFVEKTPTKSNKNYQKPLIVALQH